MTVDSDSPTDTGNGPGDRAGRGRQVVVALTVLGVLIAGTSLARDYFDVTSGDAEGEQQTVAQAPSGPPGSPTPTGGAAGTPGTTGAPSAPAGTLLDTLEVQGGAANLVQLPRALDGRPGYDRPITISCPRNTNADKPREVLYPLLRRYLDLTTTVRPWSPDDPQAQAAVTVFTHTTQPDGMVQRLERKVVTARHDAAVPLAADVGGADELVLRVECERPTGVVVLTGTRLTTR
ncbi:hypothetical protein E1193_26815 [Micromonospora sp. KC606]|uniref:hypothetical protein n=1 Tax=Micromonospora sp. KC606 TaxID=2530379 RepID=UPI0010434BEE|nr:hypothetical protein [Micromonospora sp. KC606]TDC72855.1 hypothetical protein E1193_26815 [Micromonospora sp. KC606]